jgi:prophage antirepressor-like protein
MNKERIAGNSLPIEFKSPDGLLLKIQLQDGQPTFLAAHICTLIGIKDVESAMRKVPNDEKLTRKVYRSGQAREMWFVTEPMKNPLTRYGVAASNQLQIFGI